jgi:hypothetical protein
VVITVKKDQVEFRVRQELATLYHIGKAEAKPYFWPFNAPGGIPVTRAWPMEKGQPGESTDHVHQKSVWFCHGEVRPDGSEAAALVDAKSVDFWGEDKRHGPMICTFVGEPKFAPQGATLLTRNEWQTPAGRKLLDETRNIGFYDFGDARLLVLDIDLHAGVVPLIFGDTKEGSLGVRVSDQLSGKNRKGRLTNANGKASEKEARGEWSSWCDYSGQINGRAAGVAILDDPKNPIPAVWHSRAYGLMAANPFVRSDLDFPVFKDHKPLVKLAKGEHLRLRYGILAHAGNAQQGRVAEHFQTFVRLR